MSFVFELPMLNFEFRTLPITTKASRLFILLLQLFVTEWVSIEHVICVFGLYYSIKIKYVIN